MRVQTQPTSSKLAHYRAWVEAWHHVPPARIPPQECLSTIEDAGVLWLNQESLTDISLRNRIVACFKTAAKARILLLGGTVPPTCDETDVLSESYDARVVCSCSGLHSTSDTDLKRCGCKAIEHMVAQAELVNSREMEWNSTEIFTTEGLRLAVEELALCHTDIQPFARSCLNEDTTVLSPDKRPNASDLENEQYDKLYPTEERIRLSSDAKYFFATAGGLSIVDPGIQMAIADSGNDILIGDYCEAASDEAIRALQQTGAAAFAFLYLNVIAGYMTQWQFDHLIAQTIQFRIISYWRDHSPRQIGLRGSRMTGLHVHRRIDLGMVVGIVSASIATGETMGSEDYLKLVEPCTLINDLFDFRADLWRNQRENAVLRGIRGKLCTYLDAMIAKCINGSTDMIRRGKIFACTIFCFCSWMLLGSGHKFLEIVTQVEEYKPCSHRADGYSELLAALEPYGSLGGIDVTVERKELQVLFAGYRMSSEKHTAWLADVTRLVLRPDLLRKLVDIVHYKWTGDLGDVSYCK